MSFSDLWKKEYVQRLGDPPFEESYSYFPRDLPPMGKEVDDTGQRSTSWIGIPGILEFRIVVFTEVDLGKLLNALMSLGNIEAITKLKDEKVAVMPSIMYPLTCPEFKMMGKYSLTDFLLIEETRGSTNDGEPTSVPRLVINFAILVIFALIAYYFGPTAVKMLMGAFPALAGLVVGMYGKVKDAKWRSGVDTDLDYIIDVEEKTKTVVDDIHSNMNRSHWY
jgi:hypothetical protein